MSGPKRFQLPPEVSLALGKALLEVGKVGGKAIAAGVKSVVGDLRERITEADDYLKQVEKKAKEKSE